MMKGPKGGVPPNQGAGWGAASRKGRYNGYIRTTETYLGYKRHEMRKPWLFTVDLCSFTLMGLS